jgi:clan AA aspartic protease (TIGR02281 family)
MARTIPVFLFCILLGIAYPSRADTIYLKNGRNIDGVIVKEASDNVELDVGPGKVIFSVSEIERIDRSQPQELSLMRNKFAEEKQRAAALSRQESPRRDDTPGSINLIEQDGHVFVDSVINGKLRQRLIIDTGATFIVLPYKAVEELHLDVGKASKLAQLQLADGRRINAAFVVLDNVKVGQAEVNNVEAVILPQQVQDSGTYNGILGMSFLKRFNFKVDYIRRKLVLERGPVN